MTNNLHNIIWLDLETTGLDPKTDHVTQIAAIFDNKEFNVYIKPQNGKKPFFPHPPDAEVISWKEALERFGVFIKECLKHLEETVPRFTIKKPKFKFKLGGTNPGFDLGFVKENETFKNIIDQYFLYKPIDLYSTAMLLQGAELLPREFTMGLHEIEISLFGKESEKLHDALEDVKVTRACWNDMQRRIAKYVPKKEFLDDSDA